MEAAQYLEMCGGNLELAVNLYYQHFQPTSSSLANGDQSPEVVYANYSGRRNAGVTRRASGTAPHSNMYVIVNDLIKMATYGLCAKVDLQSWPEFGPSAD